MAPSIMPGAMQPQTGSAQATQASNQDRSNDASPASTKDGRAAYSTYDLRDDPEALSKYVVDCFEKSRAAKFYVEREWSVAILYYIGEQYVVTDTSGNIIFNPPQAKGRVRLVVNRILPAVEHRIARVLRTPPIPVVLPQSSKDVDRDKARTASKALLGLSEKLDDETADQEFMLWMSLCSCAFYKTWWNPLGGDNAIMATQPGPPGVGPDGQPAPGEDQPVLDELGEQVSYPEGDIESDVISPFEVYPDPNATSMKTLRWLIQAKEVDLDMARAMFPEHAEDIQPNTMQELYGRTMATSAFTPMRDFPLFTPGSQGTTRRQDRVLLLEMWEAPTAGRGLGRHVVVANRKVILSEQTPEGYRSIPYRMAKDVIVPGRFWPTSVTIQAIPLQDEINRRRSQLVENMNAHGYMRYKAPRGANVQALELETDKVYQYTPVGGRELEPIPPPQLPSEMFVHMDGTNREFDEITGMHDASRGANPSTARTGRAVFFLQEQDETRLGPMVKRFLKAKAGMHEDRLRLMQVYYDTERIVHLYGTDGVETLRFKKEDLGMGTRVIIDPRSALPLSRAARNDTVMEMHSQGMFDPMNPGSKQALRLMDMVDTTAMFEPESIHRMRAREENYEFESAVNEGRLPMIRPPGIYEDHGIHLDDPQGHRMKTNTYDWDRANPEQRQALMDHIALHEQYQMMIAQAQGVVSISGGKTAGPSPQGQADQAQAALDAKNAGKPPGSPSSAENSAAQKSGDRGLDRAQGVPAGGNPPGVPTGGGGMASNH